MTYQGPERRTVPDLTSELRSIADGIGQLVEHMDQSLPEERVKALLEVALTEERHNRTRLVVAIVSPLIIVLAVALATLAQGKSNHSQGAKTQQISKDAAVVADYVRSCLEAPVAKRDPVKCGLTTAGQSDVVRGLVKLIGCDIQALPDATQAKLDACAAKAFGG
jgi:hypothetical protein